MLGSTRSHSGAGTLAVKLLHFFRDAHQHHAACVRLHGMYVAGSGEEIVARMQTVFAQPDVTLQNEDLLASGMSVTRVGGAGVELQKNRWCPEGRRVESQNLHVDAADFWFIEWLPLYCIATNQLIEFRVRFDFDFQATLLRIRSLLWACRDGRCVGQSV